MGWITLGLSIAIAGCCIYECWRGLAKGSVSWPRPLTEFERSESPIMFWITWFFWASMGGMVAFMGAKLIASIWK